MQPGARHNQSDIAHAVLLSLLVVFIGHATAYATYGQDAQKIVVKVWSLPKPGQLNILERARREVVDQFLKQPGNEAVDLVPFVGLRAQGLEDQVGPLMAIAGGIAPDILFVNFRKSDSYIQEGFLYPLDEFLIEESIQQGIPIDKANPFREDTIPEVLRNRVPASVWPVIYRKGPDGRAHVWSLPYGVMVITMGYRKDLFREAGLDPEHPPQTWEEFYDAAERIHDPEHGVYGTATFPGLTASWHLMPFLSSAGADVIEQDERGQWRAVFDSDAAVKAFDFYRKLVADPVTKNGQTYKGVAYRDPDLNTKWQIGKIGLFFTYLDSKVLAQVNPEEVGIAPVPMGPTGRRAAEINCPMMGIASTTQDAQVRRKAWDYIWYSDSLEARKLTTQVYVENGFGRFANPEWLREFGYPEYIRQVPQTWVEAYDDAVKNGKPEPYGRNCDLIYAELSRPLNAISSTDYSGLDERERLARIKSTLESAARDTNKKMLGILSPEEEVFRRRVALGVAGLVCVVFIAFFYWAYSGFKPRYHLDEASSRTRRHWAYILLAPAVGAILLWQYLPLARGMVIAFQDYRIVRGSEFVGLGNFAEILFDKLFWKYLWNSTYYMLLSISLCFWPPIILAIFLQETPRLKIFFRVMFYLPAVTTGLVIAFLWKHFYDPSHLGFLNQMILSYNGALKWLASNCVCLGWLDHLQIGIQSWLQDRKLAMLCVILPQLWAGIGPGSIVYLAALKSVPDDYYEAAEVDGAGFIGKVRHIVFPYLRPLIIINFIGAFIAAFKSANYIFIMTGGGPGDATHVLGYEIWVRSFLYLKFGVGAAMGWILGSILIGFTAYQLRILSRLQFKTADTEKL